MNTAPALRTQSVLLPVAGGITVLACATSMYGMVAGSAWFSELVLTVIALVGTGILVRSVRRTARPAVVGSVAVLAQLVVLACLTVLMFSGNGVLGVLPGPAALRDIARLLGSAANEIAIGKPPVPASPGLLCLLELAVGMAMVLVDLLVAQTRTPAVAGLLLLCMYAVPASLSDQLLPWWAFAVGAGAFAMLLAVDRARRHQEWRGSVGLGNRGLGPSGPLLGVTGIAVIVSLIAGSTVTGIGTQGTLPGQRGTGGDDAWGLNPFTKLSGELDQPDQPIELFRVRGLPSDSDSYLRAVTLSDFDQKASRWKVGTVGSGQQLGGVLQGPPGTGQSGETGDTTINIEPTHWKDNWLPLFGVPGQVSGLDARTWHWDPNLGAAFAKTATAPHPYVEQAQLRMPSADALRAAPEGDAGLPDAAQYLTAPKVDPQVAQFARTLTADEPTTFDKAKKIWTYFTSTGGFSYSLQTQPPVVKDPIADFIFHGKQGFCEQFASSMAVMLRAIGVPSRVVVGFTDGTEQPGGYRSITTQDAHAWVDVYFPDHGWMPFDPTPLADGRGSTPAYLRPTQDTQAKNGTNGPKPSTPVTSTPVTPPSKTDQDQAAAAQVSTHSRWWPPLQRAVTLSAPAPALWILGGLLTLAVVLTAAVFVLLRPRRARGKDRRAR